MKRILDFVGQELTWTQPNALKRYYELESGGESLATLHFRSAFGSFATGQTAEGSWTYKRVGFWKPSVTIRVAESETELATFENNTWNAGGSLELAQGRRLRANTNFWMSSYEFTSESEATLVRFERIRGVLHLSSKVEVTPAGAMLAELPWLVVLGWYLTVKMQDDAAGGAAAAAAG